MTEVTVVTAGVVGGAADGVGSETQEAGLNIIMPFLLPSLNRKRMLSVACQSIGGWWWTRWSCSRPKTLVFRYYISVFCFRTDFQDPSKECMELMHEKVSKF